MRVLFLDVDGVINSEATLQKCGGGILGIDPYLAFLVGKISLAIPDLKVVLSSSWRHFEHGREQVEEQCVSIFDVTPGLGFGTIRGDEIRAWLDSHPEVEKYAILDDNSDMRPEQFNNFFQTSWKTGITEEVVQEVIDHLK